MMGGADKGGNPLTGQVSSLIHMDPMQRLTCEQLLRHPWVSGTNVSAGMHGLACMPPSESGPPDRCARCYAPLKGEANQKQTQDQLSIRLACHPPIEGTDAT